MTKIYVLEEGAYSDRHVVGVFSSQENAEKSRDHVDDDDYREYDITEMELDPAIAEMNAGLTVYRVCMSQTGNTFFSGPTKYLSTFWDIKRKNSDFLFIDAHVWAKDTEHAIKIVNETRTQLIALNRFVIHASNHG